MTIAQTIIAQRLDAARRIVSDAAKLAMALRPPPGGPMGTTKSAQDYLTEADSAVENLIATRLKALYPEDGFKGEESGQLRKGALTWVVDPIDGTSNYARGRERWCISLALMEGDLPVAGIIHAPALDEIYIAQRGVGAWLNGRPLTCSPVSDMRTAMIEMGWSPYVTPDVFADKMKRFLSLGAMPRSCGSGALALADVAAGRLDAYLEIVINLWDVAAALVLIAEAGAHVSPFLTTGGLTQRTILLAAAPGVAQAVSEAAGVELCPPSHS